MSNELEFAVELDLRPGCTQRRLNAGLHLGALASCLFLPSWFGLANAVIVAISWWHTQNRYARMQGRFLWQPSGGALLIRDVDGQETTVVCLVDRLTMLSAVLVVFRVVWEGGTHRFAVFRPDHPVAFRRLYVRLGLGSWRDHYLLTKR